MKDEFDLEQYDEFIDDSVTGIELEKTRIVHKILDEMYTLAEPGLDYKKALREGEREDGLARYLLNYLSKDIQNQIIEDHTEHLTDVEANSVRSTVNMGAAPSSSKKGVNKFRKENGLEPID